MFQMEAVFAVGAAEMGDLGPIIERLENPEIKLEQIERKWLAARLRGKGRGRPAKDGGYLVAEVQCLHRWLIAVEKWPKEAALAEIARVLPVGKGTPRNYLSKKLAGMPALWASVTLERIESAARGELSLEEIDEIRTSLGVPIRK